MSDEQLVGEDDEIEAHKRRHVSDEPEGEPGTISETGSEDDDDAVEAHKLTI